MVDASKAPAPLAGGSLPRLVAPSAFATGRRIGQRLVAGGVLEATRLDEALALHRRWGVRLGQVLVAEGLVHPEDLARHLAARLGLPYADLDAMPPDPALLRQADAALYAQTLAIPWRRIGATLWFAAASPQDAAAQPELGGPARRAFAVASQAAILRHVAAAFGTHFSERAVRQLRERAPEYSAATRLTAAQRHLLLSLLAVGLAAMVAAPALAFAALHLLLGLFFAGVVALRLLLAGMALVRPPRRRPAQAAEPIAEADLPVYTILVPLYREAAAVPGLVRALSRLDYPSAKLDIKLIVEGDDAETLAAVLAHRQPGYMEVIEVPPSEPRTKPKACNYALSFARGAYAVIYDAEDLPEADQLRKAVAAFRAAPPGLGCVQARLNYYNPAENWLTAEFTVEYTAWFDLFLPGLQRLALPIPLGGTSNHFPTALLRQLGAWDPFNVTEDADLGIRLAQLGYRCAVLASTTYEEANCRLGNWLRQRSRWIKGYMQTYLVHMRQPAVLWRRLGPAGFLSFQFFVGGTVASAILHPLIWLFLILSLWPGLTPWPDLLPAWFARLDLGLLLAGYGGLTMIGLAAVLRRRYFALVPATLTFGAYWLLISLAAYKALYQLLVRPFYWEKTEHNLTRFPAVQRCLPVRRQLWRRRRGEKATGQAPPPLGGQARPRSRQRHRRILGEAMLEINPETVCYIIFRAREFDAKEGVIIPDEGSDAIDDQSVVVLEDTPDDPVEEELTSLISALNEDETAELVALMWLGRGDYTLDEWNQALQDAKERASARESLPVAEYLLGTPLLGDFLAEGLDQHGYSCADYATGHPLHGGTEG